jgi:glycosyltransferase involved in cell wall biosynthesis
LHRHSVLDARQAAALKQGQTRKNTGLAGIGFAGTSNTGSDRHRICDFRSNLPRRGGAHGVFPVPAGHNPRRAWIEGRPIVKASQISVIIPTYNRADCIAKAVDSALRQDVPDIEVIVADDGSTDHTARVVGAISDPRVRYVRKHNGGCSSARNFGVANSQRQYVAFLDSDDAWNPGWLKTALGLMEKDAGIGAVYGSIISETREGQLIGTYDLTLGGRWPEATVPYVLGTCMGLLGSNVVARRDVVTGIGGWDETFRTSGDLDFGLRLATDHRVALVGEPVIRLRETAGSLSKNVNTGNRLRVLEQFAARRPDLATQYASIIRKSRARILRSYGDDLLAIQNVDEGERQLLASLRTSPSWHALWLLLKAQTLKFRGRRASVPSQPR